MATSFLGGLLFLCAAVAVVVSQTFTETHIIGNPRCNDYRTYDTRRGPEERAHDGLWLQLAMLTRMEYGLVSTLNVYS